MSEFEEFYIPSVTNNVIDFSAYKRRVFLHQAGAVDMSGNFYVDSEEVFHTDWVARFRRTGFMLIKNEIDFTLEPPEY